MGIKSKALAEDIDLFNESITVRFDKAEMRKRIEYISEIGYCQICGTSHNLDYPHHTKFGFGKKDDRYLMCICITCHRTIHTKGEEYQLMDRKQLENLGWLNHLTYMTNKGK